MNLIRYNDVSNFNFNINSIVFILDDLKSVCYVGTLPSELVLLSGVSVLYLSDNSISGADSYVIFVQ